MLDIMRRNKRIKAVLWLVIIGLAMGMLLFFVPGQNVEVTGSDTYAALVDGAPIHLRDYLKAYRQIVNSYSQGGRNQLSPEVLKSFGLDRQAVEALINVRVVGYAAKRLGLDVSPEEMRRAIETHPSLQDRGAFIGVERYKQLLSANNMTVPEFEEGLRSMLLARKVQGVISDSLEVSENELREEYLRNSQQAKARFVLLKRDDFKKQVTPSEADLRAYFESHKEKFHIKEQRRAQYLLFNTSAAAPSIAVTDPELKERWAREPHDETVDASHILIEVKDPSQDAAAKAEAEGILKRVQAGENFAELAQKHSDDKGSAQQGGNLGAFTRGRMVKEFEDTAFSLKPGEISNLVRTQYGYHIIKVLQHETPTLESRRESLMRTIQADKASDLLRQKATEAERLSETQKDLNAIAKALNTRVEVQETGFLSKDSDPFASQISQAFLDEIFRLKEVGTVGKVVEHPMGYAVPKLLETKLPRAGDFKESRAAVEKDYTESKAGELLQAEAKRLVEEASKLGDLAKVAKKGGLQVKDTSAFKRFDIPDPEIGNSDPFNAAAFERAVGAVGPPISLQDNRMAVLQVISRTPIDEENFKKQKEELRSRILANWQPAYFTEYINRVKESLEKAGKIRINQRAIDSVTGLGS